MLKCYWVVGEFLAGATFCCWSETETLDNLRLLRGAGIEVIISLVTLEELTGGSIKRDGLRDQIDRSFTHYVFPLRDGQVPTVEVTTQILDVIDRELSHSRRLYLHCLSGRGRTGTIVGCWLARHGCGAGEDVLEAITALRKAAGLDELSPETMEQRAFVRNWKYGE